MDLMKVTRFPYQKRLHIKTPQFGNRGSERIYSMCFQLCVTRNKSSNNGNLEPKNKLIIYFFPEVALTATVVYSDA